MLKRVKKSVKQVLRALTQRWVTRSSLARDLRSIGVREGGVLLVHTSLSKLGFVWGGAPAVIGALRDVLGPQGTLIIPTHTWEWMNKGCRVFDAKELPGCLGVLPEVFRKQPGVLRSLHPTHSVAALGPATQRLLEGHEAADTPCGTGTPYAKLLEEDGQILLLGATLDSNTAFHTLEAQCGFPHLLRSGEETFQIISRNGEQQSRMVRQHLEGIGRRFAEQGQALEEAGVARRGSAGAGEMLLLSGRPFAEWGVRLLKSDPLALMADRHQDIPV